MNDLVVRNGDLPPTKQKLNKAKLHTDTYSRTDTDTDGALITSESTEAETSRDAGPFLTQILMCLQPRPYPRVSHYRAGKIKEAEERTLWR